MAEMTAEQAIKLLKEPYRVEWRKDWLSYPFADQIALFIQQQQQTIEAMKCCGNCKQAYERFNGTFSCKLRKMAFTEFGWNKCDKWEGVSRDD